MKGAQLSVEGLKEGSKGVVFEQGKEIRYEDSRRRAF